MIMRHFTSLTQDMIRQDLGIFNDDFNDIKVRHTVPNSTDNTNAEKFYQESVQYTMVIKTSLVAVIYVTNRIVHTLLNTI